MAIAQKKLPNMNEWTLDQIAEFWDTHDSADYWNDMKEVELSIERGPLKTVSVKLSEADLNLLKTIADKQGVGHTTLIRMWLKEKLLSLRKA